MDRRPQLDLENLPREVVDYIQSLEQRVCHLESRVQAQPVLPLPSHDYPPSASQLPSYPGLSHQQALFFRSTPAPDHASTASQLSLYQGSSRQQAPSIRSPPSHDYASSLLPPCPQGQYSTDGQHQSIHKSSLIQPNPSQASLPPFPSQDPQLPNQALPLHLPSNPFPFASSPPPSPPHSVSQHGRSTKRRNSSPAPEQQFIPYDHAKKTESRERKRPRQAWQNDVDKLLNEISPADSWPLKRQSLDLTTWKRILSTFNLIARDSKTASRANDGPKGTPLPLSSSPNLSRSPDSILFSSVMDYSEYTDEIAVDGNLKILLLHFRQLVLVSMCVVMRKEGCEVTRVNGLMQRDQQRDALLNRRTQQDHEAAYFEELRNGALWVNEMIAELGVALGHRASELFLLHGRPLVWYRRMWRSKTSSARYFKEGVLAHLKRAPEPEMQDALPFSIPVFVKLIVGDTYSLSKICSALHYQEDHIEQHIYDLFLKNYKIREWATDIVNPETKWGAVVDADREMSPALSAISAGHTISQHSPETSQAESTEEGYISDYRIDIESNFGFEPEPDMPLEVDPEPDMPLEDMHVEVETEFGIFNFETMDLWGR